MDIYKIIAVGIISAILIVYLKSVNSDMTLLATVAAGIILLLMSVSYAVEFFGLFSSLYELSGLSSDIFAIIIKIIAISYLVEFSSTLIEDFGLKSISDKVVFAGKILVLTMSMPIIINLIEVVIGML